jgi:hypothetical protein
VVQHLSRPVLNRQLHKIAHGLATRQHTPGAKTPPHVIVQAVKRHGWHAPVGHGFSTLFVFLPVPPQSGHVMRIEAPSPMTPRPWQRGHVSDAGAGVGGIFPLSTVTMRAVSHAKSATTVASLGGMAVSLHP